MNTKKLLIEDIDFFYDSTLFFQSLSLHIQTEKITVIVGPSGSGKTTLFKLLSGLLQPKKGHIHIKSDQISYMMQEDLLLPWRNVFQNISLTKEITQTKSIDKKHIFEMIKEIGLKGYEKKLPCELSGGMRKRVALARALILNRDYLLLDEPFNGLDTHLREKLNRLIRLIVKKYQKSVVMITHDFFDAITIADEILLLEKGKISKTFEITDSTREDPLLFGQTLNALRSAIHSASQCAF